MGRTRPGKTSWGKNFWDQGESFRLSRYKFLREREMTLLSKEKPMRAKRVATLTVICMVSCWMTSGRAQAPQQKAAARLYNTAKQKLKEGKQIIGDTGFSP